MLSSAQRDQATHPQCEIIFEKVHISLLTTQCQPANVSPPGAWVPFCESLALDNPEPRSGGSLRWGAPGRERKRFAPALNNKGLNHL